MTITLDRADLTIALTAATRMIGTRSQWQDLRLQSIAGELIVDATDLEHWISLRVPCDGEIEPVCVHAHRLHDVVAALLGETVTLSVDGGLKIVSGRGRRNLPTVAADNWPAAEFDPDTRITVEAGKLIDALTFTSPHCAPASDLAKAYASGVHLYTEGGKLRAVGGDGHQLALIEIDDCADEIGATISPKIADAVCRLATGPVEIGITGRATEFRWTGGVVRGPRIEGEYPTQLIGKVLGLSHSSTAALEAKTFLDAIRSVRGLGERDSLSNSSRLKLTLNGSALLTAASSMGEGDQEFPVDWDGTGETAFGFASIRMERLLASFGDAVLTLHLSDVNTTPMKLEAAAKPDRFALLFGMRSKGEGR